jgi:hypothetical protein
MTTRLQLTFAGADPGALVERAIAAGVLPDTTPSAVDVDFKPVSNRESVPAMAARYDELNIEWGHAALQIGRRQDHTFLHVEEYEVDPGALLSTIAEWPFEACTTPPLVPGWWPDHSSIHGWGFFLKGAGHRLVSERIVERGPWRRLRDEDNDITLFQFHDLAADEKTALAQAKPGHDLLAPVWMGGHYASQKGVFQGAARDYRPSFYDPATRTSIVLVQEREVTPEEMGIAAGTKVHQIFPEPVDQVAFVYFDEEMARRQLPPLWLYGLEVRAMTAKGEERIDLDYTPPPPPEKPSWVREASR